MMHRPKSLYEFGNFRLDPKERLLLRGNKPVALTSKVFDILTMLVENSGHLLEKNELMQAIWPDTAVEEGNLTRYVSTLRKALGESGKHEYIETVPRRGYRFVAAVKRAGNSSEEMIVCGRAKSGMVVKEGRETADDKNLKEQSGRARFPDASRASALYQTTAAVQSLEPAGGEASVGSRVSIVSVTSEEFQSAIAPGDSLVLANGARKRRELDEMPSIFRSSLTLSLPSARKSCTSIDSLAILPLINASDDPDTEYLSDEITETIINSLSQLEHLRVMARSTVWRYKGKEFDPKRIARDLNVRAIVTGSVLQIGTTLVIGIEMVDAADGSQLWGDRYKRELSDIVLLQEEISREIVKELRMRLSPGDAERLTSRHSGNSVAYQLYVMGRFYWNKVSEDGFRKSIVCFQQAIDIDSNYALGYSGLADAYSALPNISPRESMLIARAAATKAIEIDDRLAEGHASLANVVEGYDWDWPRAESEYKRAIELDPGYAAAHTGYGMFLTKMGRQDEAVGELRRAQELDPFSLGQNYCIGRFLYAARKYGEAIEQYRQALELDSSFLPSHLGLAYAYEQEEAYDEAVAENQKALSLLGFDAEKIVACKEAYVASGWMSYWRKRLDFAEEQSQHRYVSAYSIAEKYLRLGEKGKALEHLEKAYEQGEPSLIGLGVEPLWDCFRSDRRFHDLLRRVRLES